MKKARATKILCAVLTVIMVLGTGLSAMAAVTSTSVVKYDADNEAYGVTTEVSGLAENEMVTYLVHNADSMYNVTASNIDYVDQKNATGTTAQFTYKGTGVWADEANKIYVGAESLTAPVESSAVVTDAGVVVKVNNEVVSATITGKDAAGIKTIALTCAADVVEVLYNGTAVDFFRIGDAIGFNTDAALNEETDIISITTGAATFVDDPTADGVLSAADIIAMGLAVQPADGTASASAVTSYSNGQMASWNGIIANVKGVGGGESGAEDFWYPNSTTIAQAGYETDVTVSFVSGQEPRAIGAGNSYGALESQVADMIAAYEAGETGYTLDISNYVPQGLSVQTAGDDITVSLTVPATADYKLVARQKAWTVDRTTSLTVSGVTLNAASDTEQVWSLASSAETVRLEAGTTYTATLDGTATAPVRLDFIALVPATTAVENAYAAGQDALMSFLAAGDFTKGEAGVKLGTVSASANSIVAFGRAKGAFAECGILITCSEEINANGFIRFPALGVAGTPGLSNGGFAIELVDETEGADLAAEFDGSEVYAYVSETDLADDETGDITDACVVIGQ